MAWYSSFSAMQTADLGSTFVGGEFSVAGVSLTIAAGTSFTLSIPVSIGLSRIEQGQAHRTQETILTALIPLALSGSVTYEPTEGDFLQYGSEVWSFHQIKGIDAGAATVMFKKDDLLGRGAKPSQL